MNRKSYRQKRKLTVGEKLTDPQQVVDAAASGKWLFFGHPKFQRSYSALWILNMNFACVMSYVRNGRIWWAVRNPEYPYVFKAELMGPEKAEPWTRQEWWAKCSEIPSQTVMVEHKDRLAAECEKAAVEHTGLRNPRVQVKYKS